MKPSELVIPPFRPPRAIRGLLGRQPPFPGPGPQPLRGVTSADHGMILEEAGPEVAKHEARCWRSLNSDGHPHFLNFRVACELADRERAYGLGYRVYRNLGYAGQEERRVLVLPADARPDTLPILATAPAGEAAGTVTLWFDHPAGLPCEAPFPNEIAALRSAGERLVEAGRFAISDDYCHCKMLLARLLNLIFLYACHARPCTKLVCTVNPRHVAFYLRKLRFTRLSGPRPCQRVKGALAELLALDLRVYAQEVRKAHAQGEGAGVEREANFYQRFLDPGREREAAAFLARTQRPMSKEIAAYYGLDLGSGALGG